MNEHYQRCPECGEPSLADSQGWACQKCMGVEVESRYEGDYRCEVSEGERCRRVASQCWREPYTPSHTPVIACDGHAEGLNAMGYYFDAGATAQLCRDVEREADHLEVMA